MTWKYNDCRCGSGLVETEMHVLYILLTVLSKCLNDYNIQMT